MAYSQTIFANQQIYHIFNRGVEKRTTFLDKRDYQRFLETMDYYRKKGPSVRFSYKDRPAMINTNKNDSLLVEILSFCLMPNHFHLLLRQVEEKGITTFLNKLSNSYTKYFNTRHKRVGPLFQGSFKAIRAEDDEQLLHVSRYIHLNPLVGYLVKNLRTYPYSSYREFLDITKGFCKKSVVLEYFTTPAHYETFVLNQADYVKSLKDAEKLLLDVENDDIKVSSRITWKV